VCQSLRSVAKTMARPDPDFSETPGSERRPGMVDLYLAETDFVKSYQLLPLGVYQENPLTSGPVASW
jgi:hypothetical protein